MSGNFPKKRITLDDLAAMCMREFDYIRETMVTKEVFEARVGAIEAVMATKHDIARLEDRFDKFEGRFDRFEDRFDRLETVVLKDHTVRIQRVERAV